MITAIDKTINAVQISNEESQIARDSGQAIVNFANGDNYLRLSLLRETGEKIEAKVPAKAIHLLGCILEEMSKGNPVTLVRKHAELSTIRAAELMRVSRPYLVKLLEEGKIPFRFVGAHRRVLYEDIIIYLDEEKKRRKQVLKELIEEQERLGLYE